MVIEEESYKIRWKELEENTVLLPKVISDPPPMPKVKPPRDDAISMAIKAKPIKWTEELQPNESKPYNHIYGRTHFGSFIIYWDAKAKEPKYWIESPWGREALEFFLEDAKEAAQFLLDRCVRLSVQSGV